MTIVLSCQERSLDVICRDMVDFETWYWGIQLVMGWLQDALPPHEASYEQVRIGQCAGASLGFCSLAMFFWVWN